jgi:anti-sigma B factor antagonist
MTTNLEVHVKRKDHYAIVSISGEVDLYSSPKVRNKLIKLTDEKCKTIIIDLSDVAYMDSSGVATMVEGLQLTEKYKGNLYLCGLNSMVKEVFELSRLDTVFDIFDNMDALKNQSLLE